MARLDLMVRHHRMLDIIRRGPVVAADLAGHFKCSTKTIRRDVMAMIQAGLPVIQDGPYYTTKGDSMNECTKCGRNDFKNGTGLAAHERHCGGKLPQLEAKATTGFSAKLFSVIAGEVHLRGCEFNGGFLVLNGDTLQSYPTLADAIKDAQLQNEPMPMLADAMQP